MNDVIEWVNHFVWGIPALLSVVAVGVYLSVRTRFAQLRLFTRALRSFLGHFKRSDGAESESSFRALCTALAATVGTGNIAGVAGAIAIGGPGSIFWMWICAVIGMVTKFAEATLSVQYRKTNRSGEIVGGPMYMIERGMGPKWRWLGCGYCLFGVVAAFGMGNATQINAVIDSVNSVLGYTGKPACLTVNLAVGIFFSVLAIICMLGGNRKIGEVSSILVPIASVAYIIMGLGALLYHMERIPAALSDIIQGAFHTAVKAFHRGSHIQIVDRADEIIIAVCGNFGKVFVFQATENVELTFILGLDRQDIRAVGLHGLRHHLMMIA